MSTIEQANIAYEAGDYEVAFKIFMPLAQSGNFSAQMSIAGMYSVGQGVEQNFAEAAKWYRPGAEEGHPMAQNNLAVMLFIHNPEEAIRWLLASAEKGVSLAQSMLGDICSGSYNLPNEIQENFRDIFEAIEWYKKAGEGGFSYAFHRLGEIFTNGESVEKDEKQAIQWYQKAA